MHRVVMYPIAAAVVAAVAWMILPAAQAEEAVTQQVPAHQPGQPIPSRRVRSQENAKRNVGGP
jgi:hypothetical protein